MTHTTFDSITPEELRTAAKVADTAGGIHIAAAATAWRERANEMDARFDLAHNVDKLVARIKLLAVEGRQSGPRGPFGARSGDQPNPAEFRKYAGQALTELGWTAPVAK